MLDSNHVLMRDLDNLGKTALAIKQERDLLLSTLKSIRCIDCSDGILLHDSLMFDLDREDEEQKCPNCTIRLAAIAKVEGRA